MQNLNNLDIEFSLRGGRVNISAGQQQSPAEIAATLNRTDYTFIAGAVLALALLFVSHRK